MKYCTFIGVFGCMLLLVGGLGMKDTMERFLEMFNKDISNYTTKINLSESSSKEDALSLALDVGGDWQASCGISYEGKTITLEVYSNDNEKIRFLKKMMSY